MCLKIIILDELRINYAKDHYKQRVSIELCLNQELLLGQF